eukprot:s240_g40.t1
MDPPDLSGTTQTTEGLEGHWQQQSVKKPCLWNLQCRQCSAVQILKEYLWCCWRAVQLANLVHLLPNLTKLSMLLVSCA